MPYVNAMIDEREANPTDDLTTAFIEAEVDGERLSHEEVLMFFFLLMVAGNDSTRAVFTSGIKSLLDDPEQMELVRSGAVPLEQVVEEFVRFHPAFAYMRRTATATPSSRASRSRPATSWRSGTSRATATRPSSTTRTVSTCAATPTRTRASAAAGATSASAPGSPGSS